MREFNYTMRKALTVGLRATNKNKRGQQALVLSTGAYPEDGALGSIDSVSSIDISSIDPAPEFPFPQIFELDQIMIVCTATQIYEYNEINATLALRLSGLTSACQWVVADFGNYLVLVNGDMVVYRDGETKEFTAIDTIGITSATGICNFNGQIIITAPQSPVTGPPYFFQDGSKQVFQNGLEFIFN